MAEDRETSPLSLAAEDANLGFSSLPTWEIAEDGSTLRINSAAIARFGEVAFIDLFEDSSEFEALVSRGFEGVPVRPLELVGGHRGVLLLEREEARVRVALVDVTHVQLLQREQALSERLSALSNLAAGVAYELSNPLTVLQGRLEFLGMLTDLKPSDVDAHLKIVKSHAERISRTVRNLQVFAHPALGTRDSVSIPEVVRSSAETLSSRLGRIELVMQLMPVELTTSGDPALLKQVFTALILSVADGVGRVGRLLIETEVFEGHVSVTVCGESQKQAIDRGSSWQEVSETERGAGFGPALAATIVRAHGGRLKYAVEGSKTAFRVELPGYISEPEPSKAVSWDALFVDDDSELCDLATDMIEAAGHSCTSAPSAEEAIAVLETQAVDVVIADVRLPGMSGIVLQEVIAKRWPALAERVVLVTGLSIRPPSGVRLLQKPFTQAQLLSVLNDLIRD